MKRLIACLLFVCLVFAMTACQQPATQLSTEPTVETIEPNLELEWKARETWLYSDHKKGVEFLTYETANRMTDTSPDALINPDSIAYEKEYFEKNSLLLIKVTVADYIAGAYDDYVLPIIDITPEEDQLVLAIQEEPLKSQNKTTIGAAYTHYTLVELYNFVPRTQNVKFVYISDEPIEHIGARRVGIIELTKEESEALPQFQYLDCESTNALIEQLRSTDEARVWLEKDNFPFSRGFFNSKDIIMVQAVVGADGEYQYFGDALVKEKTLVFRVTRTSEPTDVTTGENTKYLCFLISARSFRPQFTDYRVEYYNPTLRDS